MLGLAFKLGMSIGIRRHCALWVAVLLVLLGVVRSASGEPIRVGGTGSALGTMKILGEAFTRQNASKIELTIMPNLGSSGALRALQAGAIDIALLSRPLSDAHHAAGLVAFEYGRSPFVLVTSKPGIGNLTPAALADLLAGRTLTWSDGQPVRLVLRPKADIDSELLASLSRGIAEALTIASKRQGMVMAATDQEAAEHAERLPGSLAVSTLALILSEHRKLNMLSFDGVAPSVAALADGSYRHFKSLAMVTRGAPSGAALQFIEFVRSPQGRAILEANGHLVSYKR